MNRKFGCHRLRFDWVLWLALCLGLAGCQSGPSKYSDESGLGEEQEESTADIYVGLAIAYLQTGDTGTALRKIRRGLELDPENARAHTVIALTYERLEETELASRHYLRSIELAPRDPFTRNAYGSFLCNLGRYADSVEQFDAALSNPLYETPEVALTNAGTCMRRAGKLDLAEQYLRRALRFDPQLANALIEMGEVRFDQGNYQEAREYLQRFLEVTQATSRSLWLGYRTEMMLGDRAGASDNELVLRTKFPNAVEIELLNEWGRR